MAGDNQNTQLPSDFSSRQRWFEITVIFLVFFIAGGVPVPNVNETHYLTKAKHYWNPAWCQGDLFLESADAHLAFYWTIGWLTRWFSLATVAWIGRIVAWFALAWSWQRLSSRIVPQRGISLITAMLLVTLIEWFNFAGEWVVGGIEGKCFAYVFVFCGLTELASAHWKRVWPLLGIASAFHVLVGGWSVVCAAFAWCLEKREAPSFSKMWPSLLIGGVCALPGVIPGLLLSSDVSPDVRDQANQIYVFERLPHHLAPHLLPTSEIFERFVRFGFLLIVFAVLTRTSDLQTDFALRRIQRFAWGSVIIMLLGLSWEFATISDSALSAKLLKYYWFRLSDIAVPLAIALSLGVLIATLSTASKPTLKWAGILATCLPMMLLAATAADRWFTLTPIHSDRTREALGWRDTCRWARENTAVDALFMIPRHSYTFRWHAQRPVFFTWKDVPQNSESLVEWWRRYEETYFGNIDEFGEKIPYGSLQDLGAERLREVAAENHIDYILTSEYPPLPFAIAYENPWYKIYDVRQKDKAAK